jgi:hypothetical protein
MRKVIRKRIKYDRDGVQVEGDVNAVIATNVSRRGASTSATSVSSRQRVAQSSPKRGSRKAGTDA